MSRFGLDVKDAATFIVSRKRFMDVMGYHDDIRRLGRPREGDIIFFDYPYSMFEIKFVKHDNPFYPGGDRYSFKLSCEIFKYSNEKISTGETEMDDIMEISSSYLQGLTFGGGAGTYAVGEEVYTGALATKKAYGNVNIFTIPAQGAKSMRVNRREGVFEVGDLLIGVVSGASYTISGVYDTTVRAGHQEQQDNEQLDLETERDNIFDHTDADPFSEGNY
jgi:hypothetical protein